MNHIEAMKQALVDEDGENRAVRWFLAAYLNPGMSVGGMKAHLKLSGYPLWPDWVDRCHPSEHLTKAGAQLWIRHLFALEATPPAAQAAPVPLTDDQIRVLAPKPDGVAEADVRRVEVLPGVMGTEFDEVDAWSMPLVLQIARAIEAAHGITEKGQP